jgi:hypothetical protein
VTPTISVQDGRLTPFRKVGAFAKGFRLVSI